MIKKDKQILGLVDKLASRFRGSEKGRVVQDTAFCLTLFSHNERTFKILKDNFCYYSDKLADNEVFVCFSNMIQAFKKNFKGDVKVSRRRT